MDDWMLDCPPSPIEIMAMTEPMPMTMPSMVKPDRTLLARRAEEVS
jgi:hypothetical protein